MSAVNRRQFMQGSASVAAAVAAALYAEKSKAAFFLGGSTPAGGSGFYPSGHWIAAKQAMLQVYPRPDAETSANARHHWAYWDGTNDIAYEITLGVAFGAFPFVFELVAGTYPPGMSIQATTWNTAWMPGTDAATNGYGKIVWHPQGNISTAWNSATDSPTGTVQIKVTDQERNSIIIEFALQTSSSTSNFLFINQDTGNDSNSGAIGTPLKSLAGAFGSTYAASLNVGAHVYVYGSSSPYILPNYMDQSTLSAALVFNTATKPMSLMTVPGDSKTVSFDVTGGSGTAAFTATVSGTSMDVTAISYGTLAVGQAVYIPSLSANPPTILSGPTGGGTGTYTLSASGGSYSGQMGSSINGLHMGGFDQTSDLFLQGVTCAGSYTSAAALENFSLFVMLGSSSTGGNDRVVIDGITWTDSGYGWHGTDNAAFVVTNRAPGGQKRYYMLNGLYEPSRQSGTPGNNFAGCSQYATDSWSVQYCFAGPSTGHVDAAWYQKSDCTNCSTTMCQANFTGIGYSGWLQDQDWTSQNNEYRHCLFFNLDHIGAPDLGYYNWGALWIYRCSFPHMNFGINCNDVLGDPPSSMLSAITTNPSGGSLAAGSYDYCVTATSTGPAGESLPSNIQSITITAGQEPVLTWNTSITNAAGWKVYRRPSGGSWGTYYSVSGATTSTFTDTGAAGTTGAPPTIKGPYVYDSNVLEVGNVSVQPPTYPHCQNDGVNTIPGNQVGTAGTLFNADGTLINSAHTGLVGAQIA